MFEGFAGMISYIFKIQHIEGYFKDVPKLFMSLFYTFN